MPIGLLTPKKIGLELRFSLERDLINMSLVQAARLYTTSLIGSYWL